MRILIAFISLLVFTNCSSNSVNDQNCQFLLDVTVNESINLNFPVYSQLQFPSNPTYIPNIGNGGIIVTNTGSGFAAFDAADPNRIFEACSILTIEGLNGVTSCDDKNEYNLFTGEPVNNGNLRCSLRRYRTELNGNILVIFN
ncbi:Rieske (2Fe-2S) protein [Hyunsoonleella ulvae]|uniref:hypothetical protein n=1 Tax=Hyunsoonleella ulvae TaxID=2799948 RepID=UPI00193A76F5|nr:hypothetical protein [Hyunsoonleella ulvae]